MDIGTILTVVALILAIVSAFGRSPLWPSVLCLCVLHLLGARG